MDARKFVELAKLEAVDGVVAQTLKTLEMPRVIPQTARDTGHIADWLRRRALEEQKRAAWFTALSEDERQTFSSIATEVAELAVLSLLSLIDGVGGNYSGVFEIVAVDSNDQRTLLNPENSEMLHDLFSEVCEADRR
jgi:hypothetical protein